jgi:hypothetical protein
MSSSTEGDRSDETVHDLSASTAGARGGHHQAALVYSMLNRPPADTVRSPRDGDGATRIGYPPFRGRSAHRHLTPRVVEVLRGLNAVTAHDSPSSGCEPCRADARSS